MTSGCLSIAVEATPPAIHRGVSGLDRGRPHLYCRQQLNSRAHTIPSHAAKSPDARLDGSPNFPTSSSIRAG